jgi:UDP-galactopyranose mutase
MTSPNRAADLIVFSHLRWDFVFQRPQHLLSRCARERRVYFIEEPVFEARSAPLLDVTPRPEGVFVAVPRLPAGAEEAQVNSQLQSLVDALLRERVSRRYLLWYYTPMALHYSRHLKPVGVVYDCMDELSNFKAAPPRLRELEDELFQRADVVFTGGISLYEAKRSKHPNVHAFPSSVDVAHFSSARGIQVEAAEHAGLPRPRIGYAGVIDERLDIELLRGVAEHRPDWQLVMLGPVVKIDPQVLPRRSNIHYLGPKPYAELPRYLAGWDVALLPFARNDATRFISPTKTPEYLAAGRKVVSTSIRDVVRTYASAGLVRIADDPQSCVQAIAECLDDGESAAQWHARTDAFLARNSWDSTYREMWRLIDAAVRTKAPPLRAHAAPVLAAAASPRPQIAQPLPNATTAG